MSVSIVIFLSWINFALWYMHLLTDLAVAHWNCCELLLRSLRIERKERKRKDYNEKKNIWKRMIRSCLNLNTLFDSAKYKLTWQFPKWILLFSMSIAHALDSTYFESLFVFAFGFVHLNLDTFLRFSFVCLLSQIWTFIVFCFLLSKVVDCSFAIGSFDLNSLFLVAL